MSTFFNDLKYAFRQLRKNPGFTIVAVLTLAIGISANITMFSVVNAVLLRPLPFENSDRLVVVQQVKAINFSYPEFLDWREQNQVFEDFTAYTAALFELVEHDGASKINGAEVSGEFFPMLKVSACLGRTFTRADERGNTEPIAVISYDIWKSRFGRDKEILGRTITLDDKVYTIIGVLPRGFHYPESLGKAQIWTLLNPTGNQLTNRSFYWLRTAGRLKAGLSIEQAQLLMKEKHKQMAQASGSGDSEISMVGLRDTVVSSVRTTLWVLSAIVGLILLIVCANVVNLCLARASSRNKEMAVRSALGANKLRLLRQFTTESILLSLVGGIAGSMITIWTIAVFKVKINGIVPMANSIHIDPQELLFGLGVSLLVGIFLGVTSYWHMQRFRPANVLTESRGSSGGRARLSNMLIAAQIAMALVLSSGMVLMIRSMLCLSSADVGFNRENLVTFKIGTNEKDGTQRYQLSREIQERLSALPYVKSVSTDSSVPCLTDGVASYVTTDGYTSPDEKPISAIYHSVSEDYFRTLQIPILKGRGISPQECQKTEAVVVINESLARLFWPEQDPIGRELSFCGQKNRVIGVAADMVQGNIKTNKPTHLFFPFDRYPILNIFAGFYGGSNVNVVVRADSEPGPVIEQARSILKDIDSTLPLYDVTTFKAQMDKYISQERFTTAFLTVFASIALILIIIGIYGVVSYAVARQTREIGIRMALGAQKTSILAMVLKHGLLLLVIGLVIGIVGSICLTRFLAGYLYEISTTDPVTFVLAPIIITIVSMLACFIPAYRAAKTNPIETLHYE
ncbi:MAG: ABC transporter permease [Sedimentisphaerales bacterium]|nr:ABC transporter permease [Sedimentisphaerales bacterium]